MSEANRKLLVGLALCWHWLAARPPWLLAGLLGLGLGFLLKSTVLIALTVGGVILVFVGLALRQAKEKGNSG